MSAFATQMWIFGGFLFAALLAGGAGAGLDESGNKQGAGVFMVLAAAFFGVGCLGIIKALLGLVIN